MQTSVMMVFVDTSLATGRLLLFIDLMRDMMNILMILDYFDLLTCDCISI